RGANPRSRDGTDAGCVRSAEPGKRLRPRILEAQETSLRLARHHGRPGRGRRVAVRETALPGRGQGCLPTALQPAVQAHPHRGAKPIYTPPNIQSAVQILKSNETLDPVRAKHLPDMSATEFSNNVRVEVSKQSEFIDVSFDHPNPKLAEAVANDLMQEGLKTF